MADEHESASPNEELADKILDKLVGDGLISEQRRVELRTKLIAGSMKARDWPVWLLAAAPRKPAESENG